MSPLIFLIFLMFNVIYYYDNYLYFSTDTYDYANVKYIMYVETL